MDRLDDLLEGRLDSASRNEAEEHLLSCRDCRALRDLAGDEGAPIAPPADLLGAVLARTSGPACGRAQGRLCDHADRLLAPVDDDLVRMHLEGCGECAGLAAALVRLATDLPPLAEIEPGARFVADVLARTSRRETLPARLGARLRDACRRLARRPRIAWEGAYAGSIALLILFGTPNAPFAGVPGKALDLVRTVQESAPAAALGDEVPRIRTAVRSRWEETRTGVKGRTRDLVAEVQRRSSRTWDRLMQDLGTVWDRVASQEATKDTNGTVDAQDDEGER
ncbi:MAG TPA: zf-HC2 domain-containing protein [Candidatus Polarisedimenticolia bacterium]|jgi:hypothetical protein|nr:zf-HC2 domain-containing protein [Candidatus Polarisedimenticolia bacterium]